MPKLRTTKLSISDNREASYGYPVCFDLFRQPVFEAIINID